MLNKLSLSEQLQTVVSQTNGQEVLAGHLARMAVSSIKGISLTHL